MDVVLCLDFIEEHKTMTKTKAYIAIDLKSFYASVECKERNRDPLTTNLVVADQSRTEKTICLAVSPSLKSYGIPGRPRLFEVVSVRCNVSDFTACQEMIESLIKEYKHIIPAGGKQ